MIVAAPQILSDLIKKCLGALRRSLAEFLFDQRRFRIVTYVAPDLRLQGGKRREEQRTRHARSSRNSDPGVIPDTINRSRARVQAT